MCSLTEDEHLLLYAKRYPLGQAKKQRLKDSLTRVKLPLKELKPVHVPQFQTELVALKQAQFNLDSIVQQINNFDQKIYHKDPWHVQVFESEKVQELADLKRRELETSINLEKAIASQCAERNRLP